MFDGACDEFMEHQIPSTVVSGVVVVVVGVVVVVRDKGIKVEKGSGEQRFV